MEKLHRHRHVPLSRLKYRVLSISVTLLHTLSIVLAIALFTITGYERAYYMAYFRLIPDSSRGVDHATSLISTCAAAALVSPLIFFIAFFICPQFLRARHEARFQHDQLVLTDEGTGGELLEARERGEEELHLQNSEELLGMPTAVPHDASTTCELAPEASVGRGPPPRPLQAGASFLTPVDNALKPAVNNEATAVALVGTQTGGGDAARFFVHRPISWTSSSEEERTTHGGQPTTALSLATASTPAAAEQSMSSADHRSARSDIVATDVHASHSHRAVRPPSTDLHTAASDSRTASLRSPKSPHTGDHADDEGPSCRTQDASFSTCAPLSPRDGVDGSWQGRNPLQPLSASMNRPSRELSPCPPLPPLAKQESCMRAANFYARYLVVSTVFRFLIWLYLVSGFASLIIMFACGTFGALSTALASLNTNKDMEDGWIVAYISHLNGGGLDDAFSTRLCRLQLDGRCSGGPTLCNASSTRSESVAHANFCPICPAAEQSRIDDFTDLCSFRYYVGVTYPIAYFVFVAVSAVVLTINFVLVIIIDDIGLMPSTSYACNVFMLHIRSTSDWARLVALDNFKPDERVMHEGLSRSSCVSTHGPTREDSIFAPDVPASAHTSVLMPSHSAQNTVTVTTSTCGTLSNLESLGTSANTALSAEPQMAASDTRVLGQSTSPSQQTHRTQPAPTHAHAPPHNHSFHHLRPSQPSSQMVSRSPLRKW